MRDELICTVCPLGCTLTVENDGMNITSLQGQRCRRGEGFARQEIFDPRRTVTTTVAGGEIPFLPVKTAHSVPRDLVGAVMQTARTITVAAPVNRGQIVAADIAGSGINLVATRTVAQKKPAG